MHVVGVICIYVSFFVCSSIALCVFVRIYLCVLEYVGLWLCICVFSFGGVWGCNCTNASVCAGAVRATGMWVCVFEYVYLVCLCVCARAMERACELVCAVAARLHLPVNRPFAAGAEAAAGRAREGRAPRWAASAAVTAAAPTLPFKSVSKPITADLPRDVLPSVSRS